MAALRACSHTRIAIDGRSSEASPELLRWRRSKRDELVFCARAACFLARDIVKRFSASVIR